VAAGRFWSTSTSAISGNAPIPINSGSSIDGSGITLSGTDTVLLAEPGRYLVSYYLQGDPQAGNETLGCLLSLDGAPVPGTRVSSVTESAFGADPTEPGLSNTVFLRVTAVNSQLRLVNGPTAVGHSQDVGGATTASLSVLRLS
jgi:hypothetical protein